MLPQLADLDVSKLTPTAREALTAAQEIADGAPLEEVAETHGITVDELKLRLEYLAAEFREQAGTSALRRLTEDEYEALRDSIADHGQAIEILADRTGTVIDGRHRLRACRELGVEPRIRYLDDDIDAAEIKSLSLVVNLARRQLTAGDRRGIIRDQLLRDAARSDRAIATSVGVSPTTVGTVRRELEAEGKVSTLDTRIGADGKAQAARKPERDPKPAGELPDGLVDVTLRLTRQYADQLDGGKWLDCRALRLVLVGPGAYTLEVKE